MQILRLFRKITNLYGICALCEDSDVRLRYVQKIVILILTSFLFLIISFSIPEVLNKLKIGDTFSYLYASAQLFGCVSGIGSYVSIILQMKKVRNIFNELQHIFDKYEKTPSAVFYMRASKSSDDFVKLVGIQFSIMFTVSSLTFVAAGAIFYYVRDGNVEPTNLHLPFKLRTPVDANTLSGYCALLILEEIGYAIIFIVFSTIACLILSCGLFFDAFRLQFDSMFKNMNGFINKNAKSGSTIELKKCLIEAVEFHNRTKGLFEMVNEIMSGTIFFQLFFGSLFISIATFELELAIKSLTFNIFVILSTVSLQFGYVFLYCWVGSNTTNNFLRYANAPYESLWYMYPIELQQYSKLIIVDAQRPRIFQGFGIIDLNLEVFAKVLNRVVSFYLMIKNLTN